MSLPAAQMLPGAIGRLEAIVDIPPTEVKKIAVICHPHPLFAGTMHNKVVFTLAKAFAELGMATIRFNYRGVGQSEGGYGQGIGETDDALALIKWAQEQWPEAEIMLAGFSFGGYVAARAASLSSPSFLLTVAPGVEHFDFTKLSPITCPWLVIQGEEDEIVPPEKVYEMVASRHPTPQLIRLPNVTHFFHGHLIDLRAIIINNMKS